MHACMYVCMYVYTHTYNAHSSQNPEYKFQEGPAPELRHVFDTFHPKEEAMRQGALEPTNCQRIARRLYQNFQDLFQT